MFQLLKLKDLSCKQAANIGRQKITSILNELEHQVPPDTIYNALKHGFTTSLKFQLQEDTLTSFEADLADKLYNEKYSTKEWTLNGKF
jgi:lipoate-protein ligase A